LLEVIGKLIERLKDLDKEDQARVAIFIAVLTIVAFFLYSLLTEVIKAKNPIQTPNLILIIIGVLVFLLFSYIIISRLTSVLKSTDGQQLGIESEEAFNAPDVQISSVNLGNSNDARKSGEILIDISAFAHGGRKTVRRIQLESCRHVGDLFTNIASIVHFVDVPWELIDDDTQAILMNSNDKEKAMSDTADFSELGIHAGKTLKILPTKVGA
jgi:hypothetical protein